MTPEQQARNDVVLANLGLVHKVVRRLRRYILAHRLDVDDAIQNGVIALMDAVGGFDPTRGKPWPLYAYGVILRRILQTSRVQGGVIALPNRALKGEPEHADKAARARGTLRICVPEVRDSLVARDEEPPPDPEPVWASVSHLDDRSRLVLTCRFGCRPRLSQAETGQLLGCSRETAAKVERAAVARLRQRMGVAA